MSAKNEKHDSLQIGRRGELLVQSRLLRFGIDSAPMTTDRGVDLVAFRLEKDGGKPTMPVTIQVKATDGLWAHAPDKYPSYGWTFPKQEPGDCHADVIAFAAMGKIPECIREHPAYGWPFPKQEPATGHAGGVAFVARAEMPESIWMESIWMFDYAWLRKKHPRKQFFQMHLLPKGKAAWTIDKCRPHLLENVVATLFPGCKQGGRS